MNLVMLWVSGDGYAFSCQNVMPIVYDSEEALLVDFMEAATTALVNNKSTFSFLSSGFHTDDFFYPNSGEFAECPPEILTVHKWFETRGISQKGN